MNRKVPTILTLALALAILLSLPATALQATAMQQDATPTPPPAEEAPAEAPDTSVSESLPASFSTAPNATAGYVGLAVGVPWEDDGSTPNTGALSVLYSSSGSLSTAGSQIWDQNKAGTGVLEADDEFGSSLASGDFNGDGYPDLAIGVPYENATDTGVVNVLYGTTSGLSAAGSQIWDQDRAGTGKLEANDEFGFSLTTGDFNGDGYDDLAVGVPGESIGSTTGAGSVNVLYGTSSGLAATGAQIWDQNEANTGTPEADDGFGYVLTTGDFNGDGYDDLAVGVPYEDDGSTANSGVVNVLYGSQSKLSAAGSQIWDQDRAGTGVLEPNDWFGYRLISGDFNGDGYDDLAVGVPYEDDGSTANTGAVNVLYGSRNKLSVAGSQIWDQNRAGTGVLEESDMFGRSLAAGDFNSDGYDDLAVGVPYEDDGTTANTGAVNVLYGSRNKLSATGSQVWDQNGAGTGTLEENDLFGMTLAAGDFDHDQYPDLAIGVPYEDVGSVVNSGAVDILYGSQNKLSATGSQSWDQNKAGTGTPETNDLFGASVVALSQPVAISQPMVKTFLPLVSKDG